MTSRIFSLLLLLVVVSCSKSDRYTPPVAFVSFSLNGTLHNWKEVTDVRSDDYLSLSIMPESNGYRFSANTIGSSYSYPTTRSIEFRIPTNSLAVDIPYTVTSVNNFPMSPDFIIAVHPGFGNDPTGIYEISQAGDYGTITITKIQDNLPSQFVSATARRANGTFTARLTRRSDGAKVEITGGKFEYVEIGQ